MPDAVEIARANRVLCRTMIEAAGFHAVDYEEDGAVWERVLASGDCLVLAVRETALFGEPALEEWTLARFLTDGTPGGSAGPMTLSEALDVAGALAGLPRHAWRLL